MAGVVESEVIQSLGTDETSFSGATTEIKGNEAQYWWKTTGRDLANMLHEADYPEEAQRQFLGFYRDIVCPYLGSHPDSTSAKSAVGKDGDPIEYSFEFKGSTKNPGVRFGVDLSPLRPVDTANPLGIATSQKVIDALGQRTPGFDDTWYRALCGWFVYSHLSKEEQDSLIEQAGHRMPIGLGFDIHTRLSAPEALPAMAKVYFPPCFAAAEKGITRWDAVRMGILRLPQIESFPNILQSLETIEDFLSTQPDECKNGVRYLATDFLAPEKTRLKIYMRCPGPSFEHIWEFYTLGGRIPGLEEYKDKFRDLMNLMSDANDAAEAQEQTQTDESSLAKVRVKTTTIYFSLSAENLGPAPKIGFSLQIPPKMTR